MFCGKIKSLFNSAVDRVASRISDFAYIPGKDLTRSRKLPPDKLIAFMVSEGSSSTKNELLDFFGMDPESPTSSAFSQQRAKLKPEAFEAVLHNFNSLLASESTADAAGGASESNNYRFIAADGSTATYSSSPSFSPPEYFSSPGNSIKGCYSIHVNAFFDMDMHTYTDAVLQPVHGKDEYLAFCTVVDRHPVAPGTRNVYIGDRGYCSYNNMAHVLNSGQHFVFRAKDINSKGMLRKFDYPDGDSFDISVDVDLVRSNSRKIHTREGSYRRFVNKAASFDYLEYGSEETYELSFRIVRFPISDGTFECLVTSLPKDGFPPEKLKRLYFARWGVETSFRKLKYTIGLSNFHAKKPECVMQEIWARLTAYNITEVLAAHAVVEHQKETKHDYKVNFSVAAHICRCFIRPTDKAAAADVEGLLSRELIPIRNGRQYPRLQTAHFRKPRYFIYRAS